MSQNGLHLIDNASSSFWEVCIFWDSNSGKQVFGELLGTCSESSVYCLFAEGAGYAPVTVDVYCQVAWMVGEMHFQGCIRLITRMHSYQAF